MSEIIKKHLKSLKGKTVKVFMDNNFHYRGRLNTYDESYIELLDFKLNRSVPLRISHISNIEEDGIL